MKCNVIAAVRKKNVGQKKEESDINKKNVPFKKDGNCVEKRRRIKIEK